MTQNSDSATTRILARPGWCVTHEDMAWRYYDGSIGCWYATTVESSPNVAGCKVVPAVLTVRGKRIALRGDR